MSKLSVVILTFNEAMHIERAVRSVKPVADRVFIVDSGSTDGTRDLAEELGCVVLNNPWTNYATQMNWALDNCPIQTTWVMRLDADEYLTDELQEELKTALDDIPDDVTAFRIPRRVCFMDRWIKHGGMGERLMLRIWRHGLGKAEQRWMDEHTVVREGRTIDLKHAVVDHNLNTLTWWTNKHNTYASREAIDYLLRLHGYAQADADESQVSGQAARIRFLKHHIYYRMPPMMRSAVFFMFRYIFQLGFLDGVSGTYYHFLQGWWYRTLVDAKVFEVERYRKDKQVDLAEAIKQILGYEMELPSKQPEPAGAAQA